MILPRRKLLLAAPALVLPYRRAEAQFALPGISGPGTPAVVSGGPAAWTLIATATGHGLHNFTTTTVDTSTANLLVAGVNGVSAFSWTWADSKSNTWATTTPGAQQSYGGNEFWLYYALSPTVGSGHTFTLTSSVDTACSAVVFAFKSASGTPYLDPASGTTTTGTSSNQLATTARSPATANELGFSLLGDSSTELTYSINDSYSAAQVDGVGGAYFATAFAWKILPTNGPTSPTWTFSGSSPFFGASSTFMRI